MAGLDEDLRARRVECRMRVVRFHLVIGVEQRAAAVAAVDQPDVAAERVADRKAAVGRAVAVPESAIRVGASRVDAPGYSNPARALRAGRADERRWCAG